LDSYEENGQNQNGRSRYSLQNTVYEMKNLNKILKSESFKKALIISVGADSLEAITTAAVGIMSEGIEKLVSATGSEIGGKMVGNLTKAYGDELVRQIKSFAEIVALYMLYRVAHKELFGLEQSKNTYIYSLAQK
jgi:hypothetical protein